MIWINDEPFERLNIRALRLMRLVRRMTYDDVLLWEDYQLEYVCPLQGYPYYRLSKCWGLVGIVDIRTPSRLQEVQYWLARYLDAVGFYPEKTRLVVFGAQTAMEANKHRLPHLFRIGLEQGEDSYGGYISR